MRKRLLPALLAFCMVLTLLPGTALAEQSDKRYYRSTLSTDEGKIYDAFADNLEAVKAGEAVKVDKAAVLAVRKAVYAFNRDYTGIFWLDSGYSIRYVPDGAEVSIDRLSSWTKGTRTLQADETAVSAAVAAIVKEARKESGAAAQLRYAHDWLTRNNRYHASAASRDKDPAPWSAISALDAKLSPVCEGYSRAFKLICDELGIPCILVSGSSTNSQSKTAEHMWNYVRLHGNWYAVDVTWDDPVTGSGGDSTGTDTYFLVGRNTKNEAGKRFADSHKNDADLDYPTLSDEKYDPSAAPKPVDPVLTVEEKTVAKNSAVKVEDITKSAKTADGKDIPGTWAFTGSVSTAVTGKRTVTLTFTPDDLTMYNVKTVSCKLTIAAAPK